MRFVLGADSVTALVNDAGVAAATLTAPGPNRQYALTAQQSGPGCPVGSASTSITVVGPYITGPTRAVVDRVVTLTGRGLRPGRSVTWQVTRAGTTVDTRSDAASRTGVSSYRFAPSEAGGYTITLSQGRQRTQARIVVR